MSCHMRRLTQQIILSLLILPQTKLHACCPSNFFPRTLFKKVHFTLLTFPAQSIEQWCHCYFPVHNSTCPSHPYPQKKKIKLIKKNNFKKKLRIKNFKIRKHSPTPLSHAVDRSSLFPHTLSLSMWGSFCWAVLGQLAQILSQQHSASSLSHTVDCGLPVLHTREFLRSCPWAVSSNSQLTVLGQYLVTCRRPRLACAPHEGDFLNSL